jgi:hypothetical protein
LQYGWVVKLLWPDSSLNCTAFNFIFTIHLFKLHHHYCFNVTPWLYRWETWNNGNPGYTVGFHIH